MAITNNSKLISAINKQGISTDPGCGCGAVMIGKTEALPAGDYVAFQSTDGANAISLTDIVFKGVPIEDKDGNPITALGGTSNRSKIFYANIESCINGGVGALIFYKRCK